MTTLPHPGWAEDVWREYPVVAGHYRMRQPGPEHWTKRPMVPVLIEWVEIPDEDNPALCVWDWRAWMSGEEVSMSTVWPWALKGEPITAEEYEEMINAHA